MNIRLGLVVALIVTCVAGLSVARAQSVDVCTFTAHVTLSPGASLDEVMGTFTTRAGGVYGDTTSPLETGRISCTGTTSGSGTAGFEGHNGTTPPGEDCAHGTGDGVFAYTIDGTKHRVPYIAARGLVLGAFEGSENGDPVAGAYTFTPDPGEDCATAPVTGASVTGTLLLAH